MSPMGVGQTPRLRISVASIDTAADVAARPAEWRNAVYPPAGRIVSGRRAVGIILVGKRVYPPSEYSDDSIISA